MHHSWLEFETGGGGGGGGAEDAEMTEFEDHL